MTQDEAVRWLEDMVATPMSLEDFRVLQSEIWPEHRSFIRERKWSLWRSFCMIHARFMCLTRKEQEQLGGEPVSMMGEQPGRRP